MSSILGLWGTTSSQCVERAVGRLRHWGPDLCDQRSAANCTLMRFGSIIAPESEFERIQQLPDGQWLVADAILDNRPELMEMLDLGVAVTSDIPDSSLIAFAWYRWREECVRQLIGDFVFAVVDPSNGRMFLARDHIGARPLVFMVRERLRAFASAGDALLELLGETPELDERRLASFLEDPTEVRSQGLLKNVCDVLPGEVVQITADCTITKRQWWNPWTIRRRSLASREEVVTTFRSLTERAVADRMRTVKPVGSHISGGVDSTIVTLVAAQSAARMGRSLTAAFAWAPAFSERYPDKGIDDERHRILRECTKAFVPVSFSEESSDHLLGLVQRRFEYEGPANLADEFSVLERARKLGIRVMLSGWGGDEAFSAHGHGMLPYLFQKGHWRFVLNAFRKQAGGLRQIRPLLALLLSDLLIPLMPDKLWRLFNWKNELYPHACFRASSLAIKSSCNASFSGAPFRLVADPIEFLRRGIAHGHIGERMKAWAHWGSEAGIQYRYPLTDRRLMEFVLSLAPEHLFIDGYSRSLPKHAFSDIWPDGAGKEDPANELRRRNERHAFLEAIADRLSTDNRSEHPWIDIEAFRHAVRQPLEDDESLNIVRFAEALDAWRVLELYNRLSSSLLRAFDQKTALDKKQKQDADCD